MAQGNSGRIVIDIDPHLKARVYDLLRARGNNMRQWFLHMVERELLAIDNATSSSREPPDTV